MSLNLFPSLHWKEGSKVVAGGKECPDWGFPVSTPPGWTHVSRQTSLHSKNGESLDLDSEQRLKGTRSRSKSLGSLET